jgi:hypothetical protein
LIDLLFLGGSVRRFADLVDKFLAIGNKDLRFQVAVQRRPLTILIKINLPKVTAPIKLGPVLEEPRPQPQSPSPDTPGGWGRHF